MTLASIQANFAVLINQKQYSNESIQISFYKFHTPNILICGDNPNQWMCDSSNSMESTDQTKF